MLAPLGKCRSCLPALVIVLILCINSLPKLETFASEFSRERQRFPGWSTHVANVTNGTANLSILPRQVKDAILLLRKHEALLYSLTPDWFAPGRHILLQRLVEGAWPLRPQKFDNVSGPHHVLALDAAPDHCTLLEKVGDVALYTCA